MRIGITFNHNDSPQVISRHIDAMIGMYGKYTKKIMEFSCYVKQESCPCLFLLC